MVLLRANTIIKGNKNDLTVLEKHNITNYLGDGISTLEIQKKSKINHRTIKKSDANVKGYRIKDLRT